MTAHARLSPSAASRWLVCPGSIAKCEKIAEQPSSKEAAEGTAFHQVAGECLEFGLEPVDFLGKPYTVDGHSFIFDEEMARHMQPGLDRARELSASSNHRHVERRVDLYPFLPGQFGTLDYGWLNSDLEVGIWDWKYGAGVPVSPVENPQLMLYALGYIGDTIPWEFHDRLTIRLIIEQPRAPGGGGEWILTGDELFAFGDRVQEIAKLIDKGNAPVVAGETQCRFCPARKTCEEFARFNLDLLSMKFDDLDAEEPPAPPVLTPERRSYVVKHASMFAKWLEDLQAETLADALAGRPTPGLKAVSGRRPARDWTDEAEAEKVLVRYLGESAHTRKLKSPTQAEKMLHEDVWKFPVSGLVSQGEPKPVLVPDTDKRPALEPHSAKFEDLTASKEK